MAVRLRKTDNEKVVEADLVAEAPSSEHDEAPVPAVKKASKPALVDEINEEFEGLSADAFLPAIVLNTDGEFEFKATGSTAEELTFVPIAGRDYYFHWDDEAQLAIKSYDGRFDTDGDDFTPYLKDKRTRKMYEIETMIADPESDQEELHVIRCSPSMRVIFKQFAQELARKKVPLKKAVIHAKPVRSFSKKHRLKFWTWELSLEKVLD